MLTKEQMIYVPQPPEGLIDFLFSKNFIYQRDALPSSITIARAGKYCSYAASYILCLFSSGNIGSIGG
jgi:hypothetical protein